MIYYIYVYIFMCLMMMIFSRDEIALGFFGIIFGIPIVVFLLDNVLI